MKINEYAVIRQQIFQALSIATNAAKTDDLYYKDNPEGLIGFLTDCTMAALSDVLIFEELNLNINEQTKSNSENIGDGRRSEGRGSEEDGLVSTSVISPNDSISVRADDGSSK